MENYLNILHFCFYKAHYRAHLFANKINPANLIHKLPFQKRRYEMLGIDIHKEINKAFGDKRFGLSITVAGGVMAVGIFIFFFALLLLFNVKVSTLHFIACLILAILISYFFVFRNDKYLKYFSEYVKWSKRERRKYSWLTVGSVIGVVLIFCIGLIT